MQLLGAFEDEDHVYLVQESCTGGRDSTACGLSTAAGRRALRLARREAPPPVLLASFALKRGPCCPWLSLVLQAATCMGGWCAPAG